MRKAIIIGAAVCASLMATGPVFAKNELVATLNTSPNHLLPARGTIGEEYNIAVLMYNGLVRINEKLEFEPDLAESWYANEDATEWTFKLREGVRFHHGKELKAEDVIFTFELIADPKTASRAASNTELIKSMEAIDDYTVKFFLNEPYAGWAELMIERHHKIMPSDLTLEELASSPSGTGPFKYESYRPGDKISLVKNEEYFEDNLPKLDRIVLRIIPEVAAKIAALKSGDIDLIWDLPLESLEEFEGNANILVDQVATATWDGIIINNKMAPFDDVRVRQAVLKAIDKNALVDFSVFGNGAATHSPIPPTHPNFNHNIGFEQDIEGAKKLLAEAGYSDGFDITIHAPEGRPTRERAAVAVQQMIKAIGINAKVERVPFNRFSATIVGKSPFYVDGYFARPTLDTATFPWLHSTGGWNNRIWHYSSEKMDNLLERARRTTNESELVDIYGEIQETIVEEVPGVFLYSKNFATAYDGKIKDYSTHPYQWMDLRKAYISE